MLGEVMSVLELQSKYFPIQPRGSTMSNEIRNSIFFSTFYSNSSNDGGSSTPDKFIHKLQEPKPLFTMDSFHQSPKWPVECQVLPEKIRHINSIPEKPESFYYTDNSEPQPKPVGEEMGTIIYNYQPKLSVDYFCRSCVGGAEELQLFDFDTNTLKFESRFESGNLAKVIKITNVYYELYLRPDMYTDRYSQWYYFRIQNTKENVLYRFSIVNLNKPDSLYRYGLKPLMYSEKNSQLNEIGWMRCGKNISYYKNDITADDNNSSYTLTFNLKFRFNNDTVYIAQCYPYTYSTLQNYLRDIEVDKFKSTMCQKRLLCKSLAGNNIYVLTITSPGNEDDDDPTIVKKPVIVISARVHPGETPSSYMMAGIIDFITSNCSHAQELRDRFIFKLIPMLNPDGVIVGNSRCCLLGQDLNRQYRTVLREAFPQIYHTKVLLRKLVEENGIFLYCDLHGHSRRNNVFIYGCENRRIPERRLSEQIFPLMLHKNAADKFSFQSCKFKIQKSKEGTGRMFVWTLGVANSYTLEISLGGSTLASRQYTHFNTNDYEGLGRHFCETLLDYSDLTPAKEKIREKILKKLMEGGSTAEEPVNIPLTDYSSLSHSDSDESSTDEKDIPSKCFIKRHSLNKTMKTLSQSHIRPPKTERKALNLTKASVDLIRIGTNNEGVSEDSLEIEMKKRRSNFGRSRCRGLRQSMIETTTSGVVGGSIQSLKKYTKLLFDDPFNPPYVSSQIKPEDNNTDLGGLSQTEDECDQNDSDFKNQKYLSSIIKPSDILIKEMSSLRLSLHTKKLTVTETDGYKIRPSNTKMKPVVVESTCVESKKILNHERRKSLGIKIGFKKEQKSKHSKSQDDLTSSNFTKNPKRTANNTKPTNQQQQYQQLAIPLHKNQSRRVSWGGGIHPITTNNGGSNTASSTSGVSSINSNLSSFSKKKSLRKSKSLGDNKIESISNSNFETNLKDNFHGNTPSTSSEKKEKKSNTKLKRIKSKQNKF